MKIHQIQVIFALPPNYSNVIFTHLKLCLADVIHNSKWVKIIQILQMEVNFFSNFADLMSHFIFTLFYYFIFNVVHNVVLKKPNMFGTGDQRVKGL